MLSREAKIELFGFSKNLFLELWFLPINIYYIYMYHKNKLLNENEWKWNVFFPDRPSKLQGHTEAFYAWDILLVNTKDTKELKITPEIVGESLPSSGRPLPSSGMGPKANYQLYSMYPGLWYLFGWWRYTTDYSHDYWLHIYL